jgi:hypothetical protein
MTHTVSTPPPDNGGDGLVASNPHNVRGSFVWDPPHDMKPREERRRTEAAEALFNQGKAMLNAPDEAEDDH